MSASGFTLQLMIGPTVPVPAPPPLLDALESVEVTSNDRSRDGFSLTFALEKAPLGDYTLLRLGAFRPKNRVLITMLIGALPERLIDGVITDTRLQPGDRPGSARLTVLGEDVSLLMDLEHRRVNHRQQSDSVIVTKIVGSYGLIPRVAPTIDTPLPGGRPCNQDCTDLVYVRRLADTNGFIFSIEPGLSLGPSTAYWGPLIRAGLPQFPLSLNLGPETNVESLSFQFNALKPVESLVRYVETKTRRALPIPLRSDLLKLLSGQPPKPLRKATARGTAFLSAPRATTRMAAEASCNAEGVGASGELDTVRYGHVLRPRRLVGVRGAGLTYDGIYYVKRVTHSIKRGSYRQRFELTREGLGALSKVLPL